MDCLQSWCTCYSMEGFCWVIHTCQLYLGDNVFLLSYFPQLGTNKARKWRTCNAICYVKITKFPVKSSFAKKIEHEKNLAKVTSNNTLSGRGSFYADGV